MDVLTRVLREASGLPVAQVLGTGTMLDTARLRQVLGEHGDSEVVHWSGAHVGGQPLRSWRGWMAADEARIATTVRRAAYEIIQRKGMNNHAIGLVAADLVRAVLRDEHRVLTVSRQHTDCGWQQSLGEAALSLPAVVGRGGAKTVWSPTLDASEAKALQQSAAVLQQAWASTGT